MNEHYIYLTLIIYQIQLSYLQLSNSGCDYGLLPVTKAIGKKGIPQSTGKIQISSP